MEYANRGTGKTTKQMLAAPTHSIFVWCNDRLDYPKRLAREIGRLDLQIVSPRWLEERWLGLMLTGIVIDHAIELTEKQQRLLDAALTRVR